MKNSIIIMSYRSKERQMSGKIVHKCQYTRTKDIQTCNYYRGIKFVSRIMIMWERIVEQKIRQGENVRKCIENQFLSQKDQTWKLYIFL